MLALGFFVGSLVACMGPAIIGAPSGSTTDEIKAPVYPTNGTVFQIDPNQRLRGYVESEKASDFCPGPKVWRPDQRCMVTRGWDYSNGQTLVRTYDPQGKLLAEVVEPGADLSLVPSEKLRVESLVRADPALASVVNRPTVRIWAGGFAFREPGDRFCDRASRCVHAIAGANDGNDAIAHSIVDLMTDKVVYPYYQPSPVAAHP